MLTNKRRSILSYGDNINDIESQIIDILCFILFILGLCGNLLGLLIFSSSRRTWRISSIYAFLATSSSIANLLSVVRCTLVLHSRSRSILRQLVGQIGWICKIYEFSSSFRVVSSWITLFWMFERLMCVSTKVRTLFNRYNSFKLTFIIIMIIVLIILSCVIGPSVYMFQPTIITDNNTINSTMNMMHCDVSSNASVEWQRYFHESHLGMNHFTIRCLFSELFPTAVTILFNIYIITHVVRTYRRFHRRNKEQSRTTSWLNGVLILHSLLFLSSLFSHIIGHFTATEAHEEWWVLLSVLINCSLNFYIYCLSGKAFRKEIYWFIHRVKIRLFHRLETRRLR